MSEKMSELLSVMARLRDKDNGCPWDLEQNFKTIAPCTIEEAYEVADAIDRHDMVDLEEELGDLLLQVVFHSQMASEEGHFTFDDVANGIKEKLLRRHPHIFGNVTADTADMVATNWEAIKQKEKAEKAQKNGGNDSKKPPSDLDGITPTLPIMIRAWKTAKKAIKAGFDWPTIQDTCAHLNYEVKELVDEIEKDNPDNELIKGELGDVLFSALAVCAKLDISPEEALRINVAKFEKRYHHMESKINPKGLKMSDLDLDTREAYWKQAKQDVG